MKKFTLLLLASVFMLACGGEEDTPTPKPTPPTKPKASMTIEYMEEMNNVIYPSFIYNFEKHLTDDADDNKKITLFALNINTDKAGDYKIITKENILTEETVINKALRKGENRIYVQMNWKYNDFINIRKPGIVNFSIQLIENDTDLEITNKSSQFHYRSTNECVIGLLNKKQGLIRCPHSFIAYVNEDKTDLIDPFLAKTIDFFNNLLISTSSNISPLIGWVGYQNGAEEVNKQVSAICFGLFAKGISYSNITDSSHTGETVFSQYVRFIDESFNNTEANCVDGSVLLASILTKIGIKCYLVNIPGHMYLAYIPDEKNPNNLITIETTAIGSIMQNPDLLYKNQESFNKLVNEGKFNEADSGYYFLDISYWRKEIKPIQ